MTKKSPITKWLEEIGSKETRKNYKTGLSVFAQTVGGLKLNKEIGGRKNVKVDGWWLKVEKWWTDWLNELKHHLDTSTDKYMAEKENVAEILDKIKGFIIATRGKKAKNSINAYLTATQSFIEQTTRVEIPSREWNSIKIKMFSREHNYVTQDRIPTKEELQILCDSTSIKLRSLVMFLVSSGCRIGEALQLRRKDFELNLSVDLPVPCVMIPSEYTKAGKGGRFVFFSDEAKEAIENWLQTKRKEKPKGFGYKDKKPDDDRIWHFSDQNARWMFCEALKKAGLEERDPKTNMRVLHLHTLRKYFRTKSKLNSDITHALMGHSGYLDKSYLRLTSTPEDLLEIAKEYEKIIGNLCVFASPDEERLNEQLQNQQEEIEALREEVKEVELIKGQLNRFERILETYQRGTGGTIETLESEYARIAEDPYFDDVFEVRQRIIEEDEVQEFLNNGWRFISVLNNGSGKVIMERRN